MAKNSSFTKKSVKGKYAWGRLPFFFFPFFFFAFFPFLVFFEEHHRLFTSQEGL